MMKNAKKQPGLTPEQLELRKTGIGGSEISAVAGLNPWSGPLDVYLEKTGQLDGPTDNANLQRGRYMEAGIIQWYQHESGMGVRDPGTLVHPDHPFVLATPDGVAHDGVDDVAVVEAKSPDRTPSHWGEPGTDQIPDYHMPQVHFEMAVTGLRHAHVPALLHGALAIFYVGWDEELWKMLLELAHDFWHDHVLKRVPPSVDGSHRAMEWLRKRYPRVEKPMLVAGDEADHWAQELLRAQRAKKEAEESACDAKAHLAQIMEDHEGLIGKWGKVYHRETKGRQTTDWKGLVKKLGGTDKDIEKFTTTGAPSRSMRPYFHEEE